MPRMTTFSHLGLRRDAYGAFCFAIQEVCEYARCVRIGHDLTIAYVVGDTFRLAWWFESDHSHGLEG